MREHNSTVVGAAMNYGLYMGAALVLNSLIFYLIGKPFSEVNGYFSYLIIIGILAWSLWSFRAFKGDLGFAFSTSLRLGTMLSLFASLIVAFFTFVLCKVFDPGLIDKFISFLEMSLLKEGIPDNQLETLIGVYKKFLNPVTYSFGQILNLTFMGFLFSLVISIFYRRSPSNPFQGY